MPDHDLAAQVDAAYAEQLGDLPADLADLLGDPPDDENDPIATATVAVITFCRAGHARLTSSTDAAEEVIDAHLNTAVTDTKLLHTCLDLCVAGAMVVARWLAHIAEAYRHHDPETGARYAAVFSLDEAGDEVVTTAMRLCNTVIDEDPEQLAEVLGEAFDEHGPLGMRHVISVLLQLYLLVRQEYAQVGHD